MQTRNKIIISISVVLVAFAAGRYTVPKEVKIETKIVEVEKKTTDKNVVDNSKKKKKKVIRETKKPNGEVTKVTVITDDITVDKTTETKKTDDKSKNTDTVKTVIKGGGITVSGLGGIDLITGKPVYGGALSGSVLGPINLGIWALNNGSCGGSIGITF